LRTFIGNLKKEAATVIMRFFCPMGRMRNLKTVPFSGMRWRPLRSVAIANWPKHLFWLSLMTRRLVLRIELS